VLDRAVGLLGGLVLRVLRLEDGDLLEAHGFSYVFSLLWWLAATRNTLATQIEDRVREPWQFPV
jgi:hypothetical protein